MSTLSQSELYGDGDTEPFAVTLEAINERKKHLIKCTSTDMFDRVWQGGMPGHRSGRYKDRDMFYSSYIQTYINRDVTDLIPGVDKLLFADFIRAAACRAGQMLNVHDIATDVGVSDDTAKRWLQILENYVVAEIRKTWLNSAKECLMHYYRDKDTNEIDLVIETDGKLHPLKIKKSTNPGTELASAFKILDKGAVPRGTGAILCLREELSAIDRNTFIIPIWMI